MLVRGNEYRGLSNSAFHSGMRNRSRWDPRTGTGRGRGVRQHRPADVIARAAHSARHRVRCGVFVPEVCGGRRSARRGRGFTTCVRRPPGGCSVWFRVGENMFLPGPRPPALRHRRRRAQSVRRAQVPSGTGGKCSCHQVLVGRVPHRARCFLPAPARRALRAVALVVGFVSGQQRPPALGEPRELGSRYGEEVRGVSAARQLGQHIEPLPHRVAQHLTQNLVHRKTPSLSRLLSGFPQRAAQLADSAGRQRNGLTRRSDENHPVPVGQHGEGPARVRHIATVDVPPAAAIGRHGAEINRTPPVETRRGPVRARLVDEVHCFRVPLRARLLTMTRLERRSPVRLVVRR